LPGDGDVAKNAALVPPLEHLSAGGDEERSHATIHALLRRMPAPQHFYLDEYVFEKTMRLQKTKVQFIDKNKLPHKNADKKE